MIKNIFKIFISTFLLVVMVSLVSCDEVPVVIPMGNTNPGPNPTDSTLKVVVLQELTGVKCPNCPTGAAEAKRLLDQYDDQLIVMAIHGDFLTEPLPESQYDLRTDFSRVIEAATPFQGKPAAAINRIVFEGPPFLAYDVDKWETYIQAEIEKEAEIEIDMTVSENSGVISVDMILTPIVDLSGGYSIAAAITQGGIIDVQEESGSILEEYEHEHVLRHMFTQPLGDILGNDLPVDVPITRNYTFTIPQAADLPYDMEHLEIIAYVIRDGAEQSPIIQGAKAHF